MLQHKYCCVDAPNFDPRCCEYQQKLTFFDAAILDHFPTKMFNSETTSFQHFSQEFRISKIFGHPTLRSGGKISLKMYHMKRGQEGRRHTSRLLDQLGPEGRVSEIKKEKLVGARFEIKTKIILRFVIHGSR